MKNYLPFTAFALATLLAGCGSNKNPVIGAYEALIQTDMLEPRYVGVLVIQDKKIWADGNAVDVANWDFSESKAVASDSEGVSVMTFNVDPDSKMLSQIGVNGQVLLLRKLEL